MQTTPTPFRRRALERSRACRDAGRRVHCNSENRSGTRASACDTSSMTTGTINGLSCAMRWEQSTANFHAAAIRSATAALPEA
jgi:hypothetical protein